jgi:hypothetical protein
MWLRLSAPGTAAAGHPGHDPALAEAILACDFFSADLFDGTQAYVLTVIARGAAHLYPGCPAAPRREMDHPAGRNPIMDLGGQAERMKFMIRDRDSNFTHRIRHGPRRCRDPDCAVQRADAPHQRDCRTLHRGDAETSS